MAIDACKNAKNVEVNFWETLELVKVKRCMNTKHQESAKSVKEHYTTQLLILVKTYQNMSLNDLSKRHKRQIFA